MNAQNIVNLSKEDNERFCNDIYDYITKEIDHNIMNLVVTYSLNKVDIATPFGNINIIALNYNYNGFEVKLYTVYEPGNDKYDSLIIAIHSLVKEFREYLSYWINKLDRIGKNEILTHHNLLRIIKPGDSKRIYNKFPLERFLDDKNDFVELVNEEIETKYKFPEKNDTHEIYQYIFSYYIDDFYDKKFGFHYGADHQKVIRSVLEFKTEIPLANYYLKRESLRDQLGKSLDYNIFHYLT